MCNLALLHLRIHLYSGTTVPEVFIFILGLPSEDFVLCC